MLTLINPIEKNSPLLANIKKRGLLFRTHILNRGFQKIVKGLK